MNAYAIYLTIVLINGTIINVGAIRYFDNYDDCEEALYSDKYQIYLERTYGGIGARSKNSICKKVKSI